MSTNWWVSKGSAFDQFNGILFSNRKKDIICQCVLGHGEPQKRVKWKKSDTKNNRKFHLHEMHFQKGNL